MHIWQHPHGLLGSIINFPKLQETFAQSTDWQLSAWHLASPSGGKAAKLPANKQVVKMVNKTATKV